MLVNLCKYSNYKYISVFYDVSKHFWTQKLHHKGFKSLTLNQIRERVCLYAGVICDFSETISKTESFITEVAGDDNSFDVVCFNVIFYVSAMALFSTHFANISKLMSIGSSVLAFLHH